MDKKTSIDEVLALVNLASGVVSNHNSSVRLKIMIGGSIELLTCFDNCMDDRTLAVGMDDVVKMLNSILNNENAMISVPLTWATRRACRRAPTKPAALAAAVKNSPLLMSPSE